MKDKEEESFCGESLFDPIHPPIHGVDPSSHRKRRRKVTLPVLTLLCDDDDDTNSIEEIKKAKN
jgi:hypothetical protein